jgi:hypothetical protein
MPAIGKKPKTPDNRMYISVSLSTGLHLNKSHIKKKQSGPIASAAGPKKATVPNLLIDLMRFSNDSCVTWI